MPGIDGFKITTVVRELEKTRTLSERLPIFGLTGGGLEGVQEKCISVGMDGFFQKPIRFPALAEYVGKQLFGREASVCLSQIGRASCRERV